MPYRIRYKQLTKDRMQNIKLPDAPHGDKSGGIRYDDHERRQAASAALSSSASSTL
jgi:hypothetical protein